MGLIMACEGKHASTLSSSNSLLAIYSREIKTYAHKKTYAGIFIDPKWKTIQISTYKRKDK